MSDNIYRNELNIFLDDVEMERLKVIYDDYYSGNCKQVICYSSIYEDVIKDLIFRKYIEVVNKGES